MLQWNTHIRNTCCRLKREHEWVWEREEDENKNYCKNIYVNVNKDIPLHFPLWTGSHNSSNLYNVPHSHTYTLLYQRTKEQLGVQYLAQEFDGTQIRAARHCTTNISISIWPALHYEIQPPHKNTLLDFICHWVQDRHQDEVDSCMLPSTYEYVAIFFSLCVYVFNIIFWGDWQVGISLAVQTSSKNESNYWAKGNYLDIWHVSIQLLNVGLFFQH